jgi:hypothetical protein
VRKEARIEGGGGSSSSPHLNRSQRSLHCSINGCKRWPLVIDPQLQGIKWLRKKEEANGLKVIQLTQVRSAHVARGVR